ncbi:MAG: hypothetical protein RL616_2419 [Verrucomicrobiota bacterium]|jgi:hypothetical protein
MELKVVCQCGQKFAFDVEPVGGRMPFTVNCPVCNADGTAAANQLLAEKFRFVPPPPVAVAPAPVAASTPPPIAPPTGGLRINRTVHPEPTPAPAVAEIPGAVAPTAPTSRVQRPFDTVAAAQAEREKQASFGKGLLGGFIGALVGVIIYFLVFKFTGYRIKLLAIGVGALAGWFADFLGKGEGSKELGGITAALVLAGIVGAQYFVALGWWNEGTTERLQADQAAYANAVVEAKAAVTAVPTGSDVEIRGFLAKQAAGEGLKLAPTDFAADDVKEFHDTLLPEYQKLASGQISKADYEQQHDLKTSQTKEEKQDDENTFKGIFLLLLLSKLNLFSLAAAAGLAFKLSTNA